jgi:hypothetical protein
MLESTRLWQPSNRYELNACDVTTCAKEHGYKSISRMTGIAVATEPVARPLTVRTACAKRESREEAGNEAGVTTAAG